jgi:hypothetical protein
VIFGKLPFSIHSELIGLKAFVGGGSGCEVLVCRESGSGTRDSWNATASSDPRLTSLKAPSPSILHASGWLVTLLARLPVLKRCHLLDCKYRAN